MSEDYTLRGIKTLLLGPTGSGKTHSLVTLIESGITPFVIFTENGQATLAKVLKEAGLSEDSAKWHYIATSTQSFASMITMAQNINALSFKMLTNLTDPNRNQCLQWVDLLRTCENFVDDRTGEAFGNCSEWGTDRCLVIDSLSGMNKMAMGLMVGNRPTRDVSDWQVAQNNLLNFLDFMTTALECHFVLTGHIERETDEITGGIMLMASSLGKKLGPKIPQNFDEVVLAKHVGTRYTWSNSEANVDLKHRLLDEGSALPPSFKPAVDAWLEIGGVLQPTKVKE